MFVVLLRIACQACQHQLCLHCMRLSILLEGADVSGARGLLGSVDLLHAASPAIKQSMFVMSDHLSIICTNLHKSAQICPDLCRSALFWTNLHNLSTCTSLPKSTPNVDTETQVRLGPKWDISLIQKCVISPVYRTQMSADSAPTFASHPVSGEW